MRANSLHFSHQPLRPVARLDDSLYRCFYAYIRKCFTRQCRVNFIPRRSRAKHVPGHRDSGRCSVVLLPCVTNIDTLDAQINLIAKQGSMQQR